MHGRALVLEPVRLASGISTCTEIRVPPPGSSSRRHSNTRSETWHETVTRQSRALRPHLLRHREVRVADRVHRERAVVARLDGRPADPPRRVAGGVVEGLPHLLGRRRPSSCCRRSDGIAIMSQAGADAVTRVQRGELRLDAGQLAVGLDEARDRRAAEVDDEAGAVGAPRAARASRRRPRSKRAAGERVGRRGRRRSGPGRGRGAGRAPPGGRRGRPARASPRGPPPRPPRRRGRGGRAPRRGRGGPAARGNGRRRGERAAEARRRRLVLAPRRAATVPRSCSAVGDQLGAAGALGGGELLARGGERLRRGGRAGCST